MNFSATNSGGGWCSSPFGDPLPPHRQFDIAFARLQEWLVDRLIASRRHKTGGSASPPFGSVSRFAGSRCATRTHIQSAKTLP
ncbi:hypothetical protein BRADI_3g36045v3 [Brachypodium distachyon]|uniref:Uncharacterized protein n=1 Tax=Brachypodium distachyon TaxID=15368 RepID=A0A2K2D1F3_BRADI|nr:hypothetical protein BRADI_3g36045v3 [Brachypodium distachyon]